MKKILFLDDDLERVSEFLQKLQHHGFEIDVVENAPDCIKKIFSAKYDFISLDHDLGGEIFVDSNRQDTGMEVVRKIVEQKPDQGKFIVHSFNPTAAAGMFIALKSSNYDVYQIPFGSNEYYSQALDLLGVRIKRSVKNVSVKKPFRTSISESIKKYIRYIVKGR